MKPDSAGLSGIDWRDPYEKIAREHVRSFRSLLASGRYNDPRAFCIQAEA